MKCLKVVTLAKHILSKIAEHDLKAKLDTFENMSGVWARFAIWGLKQRNEDQEKQVIKLYETDLNGSNVTIGQWKTEVEQDRACLLGSSCGDFAAVELWRSAYGLAQHVRAQIEPYANTLKALCDMGDGTFDECGSAIEAFKSMEGKFISEMKNDIKACSSEMARDYAFDTAGREMSEDELENLEWRNEESDPRMRPSFKAHYKIQADKLLELLNEAQKESK